MNAFRILGDVSHTVSKCILIWAIHSNQSAEGQLALWIFPKLSTDMMPGVSVITQMLYVAVFSTRYIDLFWTSPMHTWWNIILKNFYILSSLYIILIMMRVYARTREREKAWRMGAFCLGGAVLAAPIVALIFKDKDIALAFPEVLNYERFKFNADRLQGTLDILHHPRICLCTTAVALAAADNRPYSDRFILPPHSWLLSGLLYLELDVTVRLRRAPF